MPLIEEKDRKTIRDTLDDMVDPVKLVNFTQELECQYCRETRQLMEELASLSDKLSLEVFDFQSDKDTVAKYNIDKIPATVIEGRKDHGIRFYGIPAGYEFATLLEGIMAVSREDSKLADKTREKLKTVTRPIHIQVFVTPT
jgi:glutaredoxin-like protein